MRLNLLLLGLLFSGSASSAIVQLEYTGGLLENAPGQIVTAVPDDVNHMYAQVVVDTSYFYESGFHQLEMSVYELTPSAGVLEWHITDGHTTYSSADPSAIVYGDLWVVMDKNLGSGSFSLSVNATMTPESPVLYGDNMYIIAGHSGDVSAYCEENPLMPDPSDFTCSGAGDAISFKGGTFTVAVVPVPAPALLMCSAIVSIVIRCRLFG